MNTLTGPLDLFGIMFFYDCNYYPILCCFFSTLFLVYMQVKKVLTNIIKGNEGSLSSATGTVLTDARYILKGQFVLRAIVSCYYTFNIRQWQSK